MVSFGLSFISMLIEDIVEVKVSLWGEDSSSWKSINLVYYQDKRLQVINDACDFHP